MADASDTAPTSASRRVRRDAAANQERVIAAAVSTMLREGRHVPMAVIAAEAGVGVGTLYRQYPHREALLDALTERSMRLLADLAAQVCDAGGTGLEQLDRWWDASIREYDQLVLPLGGGPRVLTAASNAAQKRLHGSLNRILAAGHEDRTVRADLTIADVIYFGAMLVSPVAGQAHWRRVATRQKVLHLQGIARVARPIDEWSGRVGSSRSLLD